MKNFIQYGLLLSLVVMAACGKNKSGGQDQQTSIFNPININQPVAQSLVEIQNQIANKNPSEGLVVHQSHAFFRTTTSSSPGSFWIFDYTKYSSTTICDEVRPSAVSGTSVSLAVREVNCSTGSGISNFSDRTFEGQNSNAIREILSLQGSLVQQIRNVQITYRSQTYQGYLIVIGQVNVITGQVGSVTQYVVSPQMPLLLNPILKSSNMASDGVIGAQIQVL